MIRSFSDFLKTFHVQSLLIVPHISNIAVERNVSRFLHIHTCLEILARAIWTYYTFENGFEIKYEFIEYLAVSDPGGVCVVRQTNTQSQSGEFDLVAKILVSFQVGKPKFSGVWGGGGVR